MSTGKNNNITLQSVLVALLVSIAIGTIFLWIGTQTLVIPLGKYLWNAGYSGVLGISLFANGIVFNFVEKRYINWIRSPQKSILIAILVHLVYSTIVILFINWIWFVVIRKQTIMQFLEFGWIIIVGEYIILLIISSIMYAKSFFRDYRNEVIESERLKQEAISLQYQVMQNQVNPHFLFNALNSLGSLIDIDQEKAKKFIRELSLFYRELLNFKDKELVTLSDEIYFVQKYIYLQKIRFGNNFDVQILINDKLKGEVIPMSIQMMVENAVKHNIISKEHPLKVIIGNLNDTEIFVENNLQQKAKIESSNKIGLKNLHERYKFLTNKEMKIEVSEQNFRVIFPIVILAP